MLFTVDLYGTNFHHWMKIQWEYHIIIPQKVAKYLNNFVNLVVGRHYVLVSTGIELTFLLAAGMVLCLGLRMRTLLITLRRTVLIQGQGLLSFSFCPASEEPEHKELGGNTTRTVGPHWPKGCPTPRCVVLNNETEGSWTGGFQHTEVYGVLTSPSQT